MEFLVVWTLCNSCHKGGELFLSQSGKGALNLFVRHGEMALGWATFPVFHTRAWGVTLINASNQPEATVCLTTHLGDAIISEDPSGL